MKWKLLIAELCLTRVSREWTQNVSEELIFKIWFVDTRLNVKVSWEVQVIEEDEIQEEGVEDEEEEVVEQLLKVVIHIKTTNLIHQKKDHKEEEVEVEVEEVEGVEEAIEEFRKWELL